MSDIERIPSLRKDAKQGVPKRKPRDMAKPIAEGGKTNDAPSIAPRAVDPEPEMAPMDQFESAEPERMAEPEPELEPVAVRASEPEPEAEQMPEPVPEPTPELAPVPTPAAPIGGPPLTMREMFARVEPAFHEFRDAAYRYPAEHMNDHIGEDGWTRKQMLSHIATWHDLTTDRLLKMASTGQPVTLDREQDAINNAAARIAIGKSVGEVLKDVEASYARLRRQMLRMTDVDLRLGDGWAAERIAGNTYGHYAEHIADLVPPVPMAGSGAQR